MVTSNAKMHLSYQGLGQVMVIHTFLNSKHEQNMELSNQIRHGGNFVPAGYPEVYSILYKWEITTFFHQLSLYDFLLQSNNSLRGKTLSSSLKLDPFAELSMALSIARGLRRREGYIFVDLSLFVTLYTTNFMNKIKLSDFVQN